MTRVLERANLPRKGTGPWLALCLSLQVGQLYGQEGEAERVAALRLLAAKLPVAGASGRLMERTPGRFVFVPQGEQLLLRIANPDRIAPAAAGPLLRVYGVLDKDQITLRNYRIELAPQDASPAAMTVTVAGADPVINELDTKLSEFADEVNAALEPGAMGAEDLNPEGQGRIATEDRRITGELAEAYAQAVGENNADVRDAVVERYATVREQLKSIYDTYDNYPPWSYGQINRNTNAVVAIGEPGASRAICSGVLVGQDLVLTAAHCFESFVPDNIDQLEVWFDFAEDQGVVRNRQTRPIKELVAPSIDKRDSFARQEFGRDLYDYAIVRFTDDGHGQDHLIPKAALASCRIEPGLTPPAGATPEIQASWQEMRKEWDARCVRRPQCLLDRPARRDRALYVVGYPKGEHETVHDNAWVYLPHQLNANDFNRLKLSIAADYKDNERRDEILKEFTDSYVQQGFLFVLEDARVNFQPKLGIVADTFRGNSGSPVYDRDQHCLVGMLISGAEDRGERLLASWQHHESALPVSAIVSDLKKHDDTRALVDNGSLEIK